MKQNINNMSNQLLSSLDDIIYLDIKTSGFNPIEHEILEIGAIKIKNGKYDLFNTIIKNKKKISPEIYSKYNNLNPCDFENAPNIIEIKDKIINFLDNKLIICSDVYIVKKFIDAYIPEIKNKFVDFIELAMILEPFHKEYSLEYLKNTLTNDSSIIKNRSIPDCIDSINIVNSLLMRHKERERMTLEPLTFKLNSYLNKYGLNKWDWSELIDNADYTKEYLNVIYENEKKIDRKNENEKEDYIINQISKNNMMYEELLKDKNIWASKKGFMYEYRPGQYELTKTIRETFRGNSGSAKIGCIEAPTGIGKSVGYLLSAILEARVNKKRIIISTDTKELQIQLINKDIPNVLDSLGLNNKIRYGYIKGKNNYICVEKLDNYKKDYEATKNNAIDILSIVLLERLVENGLYGDTEEISFDILNKFKEINKHLKYICCDPNLCRPKKCYKECLYKNRIEELKDEDITVINHSLLAKWPYKEEKPLENIIVDEGHNLAEKGYDFFASSIEYKSLNYFLQEIYPYEYIRTSPFIYNNSQRVGKIKPFDKFYHQVYFNREVKSKISRNINLIVEEINSILEFGLSSDYNGVSNYNLSWELNLQYSEIAGTIKDNNEFIEIRYGNYSDKIKQSCETIIRNLVSILVIIDRNIDEDNVDKESDVYKFGKARIKELEDIKSIFELLLEYSEEDDFARVIDIDKEFNNFEFKVIPLKIAQLFEENILSQLECGIFLSATLSVENNMNYFKNTLGINKVNNIEKTIKPLYDYKGRVFIIGLSDICTYKNIEFTNEMGEVISNIAKITDGHILSLFNSKDRQDKTYQVLENKLHKNNIEVYKNKNGIKNLKDINKRCVVLGSKGCFEGVDIPGDGLICVTIDKIPNLNPKDPLYSTIMKKYNIPYFRLNYPQMTIKLKQAMGRLLRSKYDYGCFVIFNVGSNQNTLKKLEKDLHGCCINSLNKRKLYDSINEHLYSCRKQIINEALYDMKKYIICSNMKDENIDKYINDGFKVRSIKSNAIFLKDKKDVLKINYFNQKYLIHKDKLRK